MELNWVVMGKLIIYELGTTSWVLKIPNTIYCKLPDNFIERYAEDYGRQIAINVLETAALLGKLGPEEEAWIILNKLIGE